MNTQKYTLFFFLIPFFVALLIGWPGVMRPDSIFQLSQALNGTYADHHPPLMSIYWGALNKIWPGPGVMLVTHLGLLWGASYLFYAACGPHKINRYFFVFPFIPPVFVHLFFILKDVGFAFSFLFALSVVAYQNYLVGIGKTIPFLLKTAGFFALIYGIGVKYQALFLAPVVVYGLLCRGSFPALKTVVISGFLIVAVPLFNGHFSTPTHSWQWVKLYDLTGISLRTHQNLIPIFNQNTPQFSLDAIGEKYSPNRVDALIDDTAKSPLKVGKNDTERDILWHTWFRAVLDHPAAYIHHRWGILKNLLMTSPFKTKDDILSCHDKIPPSLFKIMDFLSLAHLDYFVKVVLMPIVWAPILLIYFGVGLMRRRDSAGQTVLLLTTISLMLPMILFVFSMASDVRYVYLSICCLHACHPFIWILFCRKRK